LIEKCTKNVSISPMVVILVDISQNTLHACEGKQAVFFNIFELQLLSTGNIANSARVCLSDNLI